MKKTLFYFSIFFSALLNVQAASAQCEPVITPASIIMCPGTTDTLWSDVHDTYQWMKDGTVLNGETNQYVVVDYFNSVGSVYEVITTTTTCTGPDTSDGLFVDGWAFLPPYVINVTDMQLCGSQDSVMFDFSLDSAVQWYYNGNPITGANNDTLVVYAPGAYTVEGAPDVCPNYVMQLGLNLDVEQVLEPVIMPDSLMMCPGGFGTIATTVSNYDSFAWYINGIEILNSNTSSFMTQGGGHYYVVASKNGCSLSSDSSYVGFYPMTTPVIVANGNSLVSVPGGSVLSNFQWYLNGVPIPNANDSTYTPTASGSYTVSANEGACSDTSAAFQYTLSVKELGNGVTYNVYPNPAKHNIYVNTAGGLQVTLLDNIGRIVYSVDAGKKHSINVESLPKGVYILKLNDGNDTVCEKIIVE